MTQNAAPAALFCPINAYISMRIKNARQARHLSTGDVATALGIDQDTYEQMEKAQTFISASTLIHCARVTHTPVNDFLPPASLINELPLYNDDSVRRKKWQAIFAALEQTPDEMEHLSIDRLHELVAKLLSN